MIDTNRPRSAANPKALCDVDGLPALVACLDAIGPSVIAVSGGVDSMTLAAVAHAFSGAPQTMVHAISPAVPPTATARVEAHARANGWTLQTLDAGEFADDRYRANPVNRCFFCKSNLYETLAGLARGTVVSGTNLDDLGDYRPGLMAAASNGVRHPFVEAGIDKAGVRAIATALGLDDLAELPSAPCLASRIATGLRVEAEDLRLIDAVETFVRAHFPTAADVRCRRMAHGWRVEISRAVLNTVDRPARSTLAETLVRAFPTLGPALPDITEYARGSAFIGDKSSGVRSEKARAYAAR